MQIDPAELMPEPSGFVAFKGEGNRYVIFIYVKNSGLQYQIFQPILIYNIFFPTGSMGRKRKPRLFLKMSQHLDQFNIKEVSLTMITKLAL